MRIGIDARTILFPETRDGMGNGHYTYQLIRHLLASDTQNEYVLFFDKHTREKDLHKFAQKNVKIVFYPFSQFSKFLPGVYNETLTAAVLSRENLDVLHVTSSATRVPLSYRGKVIVTLHDLGVYETPESFKKVTRTRLRAVKTMMAARADAIIAPSHIVATKIARIFSVPADKMYVVHTGIDQRFFDAPREEMKRVVARYGITKKYILFLGTIEPVKNVTRLLQAFSLFQDERRKVRGKETSDYQLLIAGKPGWLSQDIKHFVSDLDLTKQVKFTGYVIGDDLTALFHNAEFFVMPSLYEGFGSTVLEAFATGTPAIVSNVGSVPEIALEAAAMVSPVDTKALAAQMSAFAADEELRDSFAQKGCARAENFSWEKVADETRAIYKDLMA